MSSAAAAAAAAAAGAASSEVTRDSVPAELRDLVANDNDLQDLLELAGRVQQYFAETRRQCSLQEALEVLVTVPRTDVPTSLADFGFGFNQADQLRQLKNGDKFVYINEAHYQAVGNLIVTHIHQRMTSPPFNMMQLVVPVDANENTAQTTVFATQNWDKADVLVLIIHGAGAIGSVLPYVAELQKRNWGVLVLNPNDNRKLPPVFQPRASRSGLEAMRYWLSFKLKQVQPVDARMVDVPGSSSPEQHVVYVWDHFVSAARASKVGIVAHSYGGVSTMALLTSRVVEVFPRVRVAAFTDAVHSVSDADPEPVRNFVSERSVNWISSSEPRDTHLPMFSYQPRRSAGHPKHEWTSWSCMPCVLAYLDGHLA